MKNEISQAFVKAFNIGGGGVVRECQCGRLHYYTLGNEGFFDAGELERYEKKRQKKPDRYIAHDYSSSTSIMIDGNEYVLDCPCNQEAAKIEDWVWLHRRQICEYIFTRADNESRKASSARSAAHAAKGAVQIAK